MRIARFLRGCLILLLLLAFLPRSVHARGTWKTLKTDHFTVFYRPGDEVRARETLAALERGRLTVETLTGNEMRRFPVVIQDMGVLVNSLTDPLNNVIQLFPRPPGARMNLPTEDWLVEVGVHEYVHALNLSKSGGLPGLLKAVGGTSLNCNLMNPGWSIEGLAVLGESQLSPHSGRLNDGFYDAVAGSQASEGRFPSLMKATHQPWEYPSGIAYLSGGLFHGYLARTYGRENVTRFYGVHSSGFWQWLSPVFPALGLDRAARKTFGKRIPLLWRDWRRSVEEKGFARIEGEERLTRRGWNMEGLRIGDGKLYYRRTVPVKTESRSGFTFYRIRERDLATGQERTRVSSTSPFLGPMHFRSGRLYYLTEEIRRGYRNTSGFGYVARLHEWDPATGKGRKRWTGEIRAFHPMPDGCVILSLDRKDRFGSGLFNLGPEDKEPRLLFETDLLVDEIVGDGSRTVATARRQGASWSLYAFDVERGKLKALVDTPWSERAEGVYGNRLLFTADYGKTASAYWYDFRTKKTMRATSGGYVSSPVLEEATGRLYYAGLNASGNDLYACPARSDPFRLPVETSVKPPPGDSLEGKEVSSGGYGDNLKRLFPRILHLPFYFYGGGEESFGAAFVGGDAVYDFPAYLLAGGYDRSRRRPMGMAALTTAFLAPLALAAQYTDAFGERDLTAFGIYPVSVRLSPGFSSLWAGFWADFHDQFRRKEICPLLQAGFHWPGTELSLSALAPLEEEKWGSAVRRRAFLGGLGIRQRLGPGQIRLSGRWIDDPDNPDLPFDEARGYVSALTARRGLQASLDLSVPALKIRKGLWNPSLYVEDLVLVVFTDGAWGVQDGRQNSWGGEIKLESSLTTAALPLDLACRYSRTREGGWETLLSVSFNLPLILEKPSGSSAKRPRPWKSAPSLVESRQRLLP